jgi:hypothetical protein
MTEYTCDSFRFFNLFPVYFGGKGTGRVCGLSGVVPLSGFQNRTQGHMGFSLFGSLTPYLSPTGKGRSVLESGLSRFAEIAHNCPTRLQRGGSGASLVSFPYPASKTAHRTTQGRVWFSPSFSPTFSRWQHGQLPLQVVIHRLVNGQNRVEQRPVSRGPVQCPHCGRQGFDEALILQLGYVLPHRVGTHARSFPNFPKARVANVCLSVLAKNQVGVHGDLPSAQP